MPPYPCCWATPCPCCWARSCPCHRATTHPDLWHLLGQRLTRTIIVSFHLHLNWQKNCRSNSNSSDIRIAKYFLSSCDWAMGLMSEGIYNTPHQEQCVVRGLGGSISEILPCTHKGCTVRVHRFYQIDWLHQHDLEVVYNDPVFCQQHNKCYQNYVRLHPTFSLRWRWTTSYSNLGAQGE